MNKHRLILLVTVLAFLGLAESAWAWGPATHVGLSETVLGNLSLLPAAMAALLARHRGAYIFGSIAADVVFAKKWSRVKQFCHHWSTGFRLLETAEEEPAKAFAFGYLSHLAADTVAHGKYVPRQILMTGTTVNFGHMYWELRADSLAPRSDWHLCRQIVSQDFRQHHRLLKRHIQDTFLTYSLNKIVFQGINGIWMRREAQRAIDTVSRHSRWPLEARTVEDYRNESVDRVLAILREGASSTLLRDDPNGTSAFMRLKSLRRDHRRLQFRGHPITHRIDETSRGWEPQPPLPAAAADSSLLLA